MKKAVHVHIKLATADNEDRYRSATIMADHGDRKASFWVDSMGFGVTLDLTKEQATEVAKALLAAAEVCK